MTTGTKPRRKTWKIALGSLLATLVLAAGGFFWYVSDYYRAEGVAMEVLSAGDHLEVRDDLTILTPSHPTDTAIIFYPGAKVEGGAYLPLLDRLRQTGLTCILVEMPFHLAIFDVNAAEDVMAQFPDIRHWYLAGHSMGGAMASQFAAVHLDEVEGLILLGAYLYGDYPVERTLTVYGSLNQSVEDKINYTENVVEIQGGNHAQFGNYGPQKGDLPAAISAEEQQEQTADAITDFIARQRG
ncbi:alpha/beta hydrolase [Anaerotruncus colihominis]|uniref:Carboxymethylenebutenolidase n=1 Tax=Anaerotruncus colihominis TaxID=169435 RepID=A0A3E3IE19_9FIRM|nr:alpha/beta hydrolase [Anaerotruncus colihominis]RGE65324.1 carboxymethylenebutenolidase [Anaerotruncus colihominis]